MYSRWTTEDHANFTRVRNERLPSVYQASFNLQAAVGISPGMKIIGEAPVMLWEMPEPPQETTKEMFASLQARLGLGNSRPTGVDVKECEDGEVDANDTHDSDVACNSSEGLVEPLRYPPTVQVHDAKANEGVHCRFNLGDDFTFDEAIDIEHDAAMGNVHTSQDLQSNQRSRRKRITSNPEHRDTSNIKKLKIVIDLTDSPNTNSTVKPQQSSQQTAPQDRAKSNSKPNTAPNPASPPPYWIPTSHNVNSRHIPAYWTHALSKNINRWLEQPQTQSIQISLSHLELLGVPDSHNRAPLFISVEARNCVKIKLSRLRLPSSAQLGLAPPQALDWLVVQVTLKERLDSGGGNEYVVPLPSGNLPYWLLAFPQQAITDARAETTDATQQVPVSPLLPRPQNRKLAGKKAARPVVHVLKMLLGTRGRVPLVHGRGVNPKFAQTFVEACAGGEGVVEMRSLDPMMACMLR